MQIVLKLDRQLVVEAQRLLVQSPQGLGDFHGFLQRVADLAEAAALDQLPRELIEQASLTCLPLALNKGGEVAEWVSQLGAEDVGLDIKIAV